MNLAVFDSLQGLKNGLVATYRRPARL